MSDEPLIFDVPEKEPLIFDMEVSKPFTISDYAFIKGDKGETGLQGEPGATGKSAYQSYLDTTSDNPKMTESEWSNLNGAIYSLLTGI